jgi:hypothetical protein
MALRLEEVFKTGGTPTHTFVRPIEYPTLLVALRTAGRGVVVEGPSGIGKTTSITRALEEIGLAGSVLPLSARKRDDVALIRELPGMRDIGTVIIDDFHRLEQDSKREIADFMKVLADEERPHSKVIVLGINKAGESLIQFAADLNNRIEIIPFEANPPEKVIELVELGEQALKVNINVKQEITRASNGSFYLAQMLSHQTCLDSGITEEQAQPKATETSYELTKAKVFDRLARVFLARTQRFAQGTRFRREGRAPYLHLLYWLATSGEWSLSVSKAMMRNPALRGSITQIVEKHYLRDLIANDPEIGAVLHYDQHSQMLAVEDPQYLYFLRSISWSSFVAEAGFISMDFPSRYDIALSFAGADREIASALCDALHEMELEVFYDRNEQHRMLAEDVEDYLRPIYQSDADFVVVLMGPEYPKRVWTKFESDNFKDRFKSGAVVPVWFANAPPGMFDEARRVGGLDFDPAKDPGPQIAAMADLLSRKIGDKRHQQRVLALERER